MQQPMRWRHSSPTPRTRAGGVAGVVVLLLCATAARAETVEPPPVDEARTVTTALADATTDGATDAGRLRPRWIAPLRGDGTVPLASGTARPWQSDARVIVHAAPGETRLATLVADLLERRGSEPVERRTVNVAASTDQVRFFHAEDAAMANALAAELEPLFGTVRVRDLTFYRPQPESGSLEVWLR